MFSFLRRWSPAAAPNLPPSKDPDAFERYVRAAEACWRQAPFEAAGRDESKLAVIVEPRKHFALETCVRNVGFFLDPAWRVRVVCGRQNRAFAEQRLWDLSGRVEFMSMDIDNLPVDEYNLRCLDAGFWQQIGSGAEHLLLFQTDSLMRRRGIDPFLRYDYIGSPGGMHRRGDPYVWMNGGFSLRRKSALLECLGRVAPDRSGPKAEPEDVYFTRAMRVLHKPLPSVDVAAEFAAGQSDVVQHPDPLAWHKPWEVLPAPVVAHLLPPCPSPAAAVDE